MPVILLDPSTIEVQVGILIGIIIIAAIIFLGTFEEKR